MGEQGTAQADPFGSIDWPGNRTDGACYRIMPALRPIAPVLTAWRARLGVVPDPVDHIKKRVTHGTR